jgi:hypothetical protein
MSVYVGAVDSQSTSRQYQVAIYTNNAGRPGTLVARSANGTLVANAWNTVALSAALQASTSYWLLYNTNGRSTSVNNMYYNAAASGQGVRSSLSATFGTWPTTFPSSTLTTARYSLFATFGSTPPDTTPPVLSNGQPTGTLPAGTTQTTLSLTTNENATCRYAPTSGVDYSAMPTTFGSTGGTAHSTSFGGLSNGGSYTAFVRCQDAGGTPTLSDFPISFAVALPAPPGIPGSPSPAHLATGVATNATLTWSASGATSYDVNLGETSPPPSFATSLSAAAISPEGLVAGATYYWQVIAKNTVGTTPGPIWAFTISSPPPSLVAAYSFNAGAGTTVADASGNGNTGEISGASWTTSGRFGNALSFNGADNLVSVADASSLDLTTGMTLELWVNPSALSGWRTALLKEAPSGLSYSLYGHDNVPRPAATVNTGGTDQSAVDSSPLALNTWTHLATTYDGATLRLYVNGVQVGNVAVTGSLTTSTGALRIGGNAIWGEYFSGLIDEVRIYNRALTPQEIQNDMNTPVSD